MSASDDKDALWVPKGVKGISPNGDWSRVTPKVVEGIQAVIPTGENFQLIFASKKIIVEGEFLRQLPGDNLYEYIGRSVRKMTVIQLEKTILPLMSCFPHLDDLKLREVIIPDGRTKGFPQNLRKLTIIKCQGRVDYFKNWLTALSGTLETLHLIDVTEKLVAEGQEKKKRRRLDSTTNFTLRNPNLETLTLEGSTFIDDLDLPNLKALRIGAEIETSGTTRNINCPSLEYFSFEGTNTEQLDAIMEELQISSKALTTLMLRQCPQKDIGVLTRFPNLKHLTILDPIKDTEKWADLEQLKERLETFNCCLTALQLDLVPDDCLIEIFGYLRTADWIALTHVNSRFRRIVLDYIYPTAEIELTVCRYPLEKCQKIYEEIAHRARKLSVSSVIVPESLDFPHLKSIKSDFGFKGIPAGLQSLHASERSENMFRSKSWDDKLQTLLNEAALTLEDLKLSVYTTVPIKLPPMDNLRKLTMTIDPLDLGTILKERPNLEELHVRMHTVKGTMSDLLEAFKFASRLTTLSLNMRLWRGVLTTAPVSLAVPILPRLKVLKLKHVDPQNIYLPPGRYWLPNYDQRAHAQHFLKSICKDEMKTLNVTFPFEEIKQFQGVTSLHVHLGPGILTILGIVNALPHLVQVTTDDRISILCGVQLAQHLSSSGRQITWNGAKMQSHSELLKSGYSTLTE